MKHSLYLFILIATLFSCSSPHTMEAYFNQEDVAKAKINSKISEALELISGAAGEERDWNEFRDLFTEDAVLSVLTKNKEGNDQYVSMSVEQYIEQNKPYFAKNLFYEIPIKSEIQPLHQIANAIQSAGLYTSNEPLTTNNPDKLVTNHFRLLEINGQWKIQSIIYSVENPFQPIPKALLNY